MRQHKVKIEAALPSWKREERRTTLMHGATEFGHVRVIGHPENIYAQWLVKGNGWSVYKKSRVIAEEFLAAAYVQAMEAA